jgi:hypothetical protein
MKALNGCKWSTSRPSRLGTGKSPRYPFSSGLDGPQGRSGRFGENFLDTAEIRTPECPAYNLVNIPTLLYRPRNSFIVNFYVYENIPLV